MSRLWAAVLIPLAAALVAAVSLSAAADTACVTPAAVAAEVLSRVPDAQASVVEDRAARAELTRLYNRLPPVTHIEADRIVAFQTDRIPKVHVVFFLNGCWTGSVTLPKPVYRRYLPAGLSI